ncbi:hypothetical protein [Allorhodopirellula heiligendammensis]|uniref:Uncharacterized protein n=1 Tax=Allorhodopirellula heiligendammensis TaxID=2714739 RepID=A0A5C6B3Q6_9BACT|nr:hypothetical protein [Allorhodopirellula heiligendammensis]TWU06540.1 hypothetical protein Poly21_56070 [Allorhodopirellula heiligendammensis]
MNKSDCKSAMIGPRRFQWQVSGWCGGVFGGSAWLVPIAAILAFNGQPKLAILPAGSCVLMNLLGAVLWYLRDRILPFPALMGLLAAFSVSTPLIWFATSLYATPESLASLNWPQHAMPSILAALICPVIIAWFCILEYSHANEPVASQRVHR